MLFCFVHIYKFCLDSRILLELLYSFLPGNRFFFKMCLTENRNYFILRGRKAGEEIAMIKNLKGIHETVSYRDNTNVLVHDNHAYEEYPPHWHTAIEYNGNSCRLSEGDIIFICPGVLHRLPAVQGRRCIFQAELASVSSIKGVDSVLTFFSPALLLTKETFPDIYEEIRQMLLEIAEEYRQQPPLYEAAFYSRLLRILTLIARNRNHTQTHFHASQGKQQEYIEKFMNICSYISDHCTENLTLDMVADLSGFSKYHFTRLFKQFTNVSFYKYLNQKRMLRAEQLLVDPSASITDVAFSCGFSSLSAFVRMFKLMKGCTPSEFRGLHRA